MKTAVSKKFAIALITLVWALVGCESDLDKCINEFTVQVGKEKAEQAKQTQTTSTVPSPPKATKLRSQSSLRARSLTPSSLALNCIS